jgi:hypothetical protein
MLRGIDVLHSMRAEEEIDIPAQRGPGNMNSFTTAFTNSENVEKVRKKRGYLDKTKSNTTRWRKKPRHIKERGGNHFFLHDERKLT